MSEEREQIEMTHQAEHIIERIRRLERENRRFKMGITALLGVCAAGFYAMSIGTAAATNTSGSDETWNRVIRVRGLVIVDENNQQRIFLGHRLDWHSEWAVAITDPQHGNKPLVNLHVYKPADGGGKQFAFLNLNRPDGSGNPVLSLNVEGEPQLWQFDKQGNGKHAYLKTLPPHGHPEIESRIQAKPGNKKGQEELLGNVYCCSCVGGPRWTCHGDLGQVETQSQTRCHPKMSNTPIVRACR